MSHQENITRIKAVYNALGPLKDKVVFVGGATISLYREGSKPEVRATEDVDIVIELSQNAAGCKNSPHGRTLTISPKPSYPYIEQFYRLALPHCPPLHDVHRPTPRETGAK